MADREARRFLEEEDDPLLPTTAARPELGGTCSSLPDGPEKRAAASDAGALDAA